MTTKVHSNGWGVQSVTLAWMQALGDIEPADLLIFSDTGSERRVTYDYIKRWQPELMKYHEMVTVHAVDKMLGNAVVDIPAFTIQLNSLKNSRGQIKRQCTHHWKIMPIRRFLRANGLRSDVEMWLSISTDEAARMKPSDVKYITNRWPLIELGMSREDCIDYLNRRGIEIPPKSGCTYCPFHDTATWREVMNDPQDREEAIRVDYQIRDVRPGNNKNKPRKLYVHPARIPLDKINFSTAEERGQRRLWDDECDGYCGL